SPATKLPSTIGSAGAIAITPSIGVPSSPDNTGPDSSASSARTAAATLVTTQSSGPLGGATPDSTDAVQLPLSRGLGATGARSIASSGSRAGRGGAASDDPELVPSSSEDSASSSGTISPDTDVSTRTTGTSSNTVASKSSSVSSSIFGASSSDGSSVNL